MKAPDYDHNDVWENEIKPLSDRLVDICTKNGMPIMVVTVTKCDGEHAEFAMGFMPGENKWVPDEMLMAAMILRMSDHRILVEFLRIMRKHALSLPTDVSRN